MGVSAACGVTCIITGIKAAQYRDKTGSDEAQNDQQLWNEYYDKFKNTKTVSIISGVCCGVSLPLSLFLLIKKDKSTMTKKVSLNIIGGKDTIGIGIVKYY